MDDVDAYVKALEKLKGRDRVGVGGEIVATGAATAAGAAASGTVASALGASTLLGSSTLGSSLLGGRFVTTTPVGWVVGSALAAGALGYGISKVCRSGGKNDQIRRTHERTLRAKVEEARKVDSSKHGYDEFIDTLKLAVTSKLLTPEKSDRLIGLVNDGKLGVDMATRRVQAMISNQPAKT